MKTHYIWSDSDLLELTGHFEPEVQEWAVSTFFSLYPELAREQTARFLESDRENVVRSTLEHLSDGVREELIPTLRRLYLDGAPAASALAIHTLGNWKVEQAVEWMQERILTGKPLTDEQIMAMISALGWIPGEKAYSLLKATEKAVQEKKSYRFEVYYAALLMHKKTEDFDTLLRVFLNQDEPEDLRRRSFGLVLAQIDPGFNPSDVLFSNNAAVQAHLMSRLQYLEREAASRPEASDIDSIIEALRVAVKELNSESAPRAVESLQKLKKELKRGGGDEPDAFDIVCRHISRNQASADVEYALACLGFSALLSDIINLYEATPSEDSNWKDKLSDQLKDRYPKPYDALYQEQITRDAERFELIASLRGAMEKDPPDWGALRAIEMLGKMKVIEASESLLGLFKKTRHEIFSEAVKRALLSMGPDVVPSIIPLLDSNDSLLKNFALAALSERPTRGAVEAVSARFTTFFKSDPQRILDAVEKMAAESFLPLIEREYHPGEWAVGRAYLHICRVNRLNPLRLAGIEKDVQQGKKFQEQQKRLLQGKPDQWPSTIDLELACKACGRRYHYQVSEIHLHPHETDEKVEANQDAAPYRYGIVICDDLRCKNCRALNQMELIPATVSQITTESLKHLAFKRSGLSVPQYYPLKHVQLGEKEGKPQTLLQMEQEHIDATLRFPSKPQGHLAMGKFYEYVKVYPKAKEAFLKALDLDSMALEALAGLARLYHAEEKFTEAYDWIERCYQDLSKGRFYLAEDPGEFKKAVREKRREFARELGVRPKEDQVEVRFQIETADYPKNRPCPCGSGKKYKMCCMKKERDEVIGENG